MIKGIENFTGLIKKVFWMMEDRKSTWRHISVKINIEFGIFLWLFKFINF